MTVKYNCAIMKAMGLEVYILRKITGEVFHDAKYTKKWRME